MSRIELEYEGKKYFKSNGKWYSHAGERKPEMDDRLEKALSILKKEKLWVGKINGGLYLFDDELDSSGNTVTLWSASKDRYVDIERAHARANAKKVDEIVRSSAIEKYRRSVVVRHRLRIHRMGKQYTGIRTSTRRVPRETHCWSCKRVLTSQGYPECIECGWILCECGACNCGKR